VIATGLAEGDIRAGLRPRAGGALKACPREWWNTERWLPRFDFAQMNIANPFSLGRRGDGEGWHWIYVEQKSLLVALDSMDLQAVLAHDMRLVARASSIADTKAPERPDGDGVMPLFCAAHWIATEGGRRTFDPADTEIWRPAFRDLLDAIVSGRIPVLGMVEGQSEFIPAHLFAGMKVAYPFTQTPLPLIFSNELVLHSRPSLSEENSSDDALVYRGRYRWQRLMVEKERVRSRWPFDSQAEKQSATPAIVSAENACRKWLESQMRVSPKKRPKPRGDFFTEAAKKFDGLSERGFVRAWDRAMQSSGAAWSRAGRPKKE
jgi:hypothetical protein